ncbi:MAG: TIR domain-containing protein, partial [Hyphococcus sp.]
MAHLFISYARHDRPRIEKLSAALEAAGHSVWWDRHIRGGAAFAKDIEAQLGKADAIIVAWSSNANESDWVKDEAVFARDKGKLIPICLTDCEAPIGFRQYQSVDFQHWRGDEDGAPLRALLDAIAEMTGGEAPALADPPSFFRKLTTKPIYMVAIAAPVLLLAAIAFFMAGPKTGETLASGEAPPATLNVPAADAGVSIAVLPFADMSPEGNQEYFADGLSEELLNVLVRVDGLKVASRTSSFALKDQILSIGEIAERLNVNHVLEGSIRKMDNRVRITAQLIDARDDKHMWSETYDRHLSDIFRIQDEIATAVVDALRDELGISEAEEIVIKPATENLTAYDAYLKARDLYLARGKANVVESMRLFEHAVEIDPDFARGW